jgi:hypothetical protein
MMLFYLKFPILSLGRKLTLSSSFKNHRDHREHREKLHRSVLSVYSVVEKPGSNSLFQEKLKSLGIEWR